MKWEHKMKNARLELSKSAVRVTLCTMLASVLAFDLLLGVNMADYAMLVTIGVGVALIVSLFYRSRRGSWSKTTT